MTNELKIAIAEQATRIAMMALIISFTEDYKEFESVTKAAIEVLDKQTTVMEKLLKIKG